MTLLTVDSRNLTGKPTPGELKISTSRKPISNTQSKVTFSGEAVEPLGTNGKASVELPPSNGAHTGATFLYSFEVQLAGFGTWVVRNVLLPNVSTIDLSELHNSAPAPGEPTRVVKVPADGADGQVLVWDGAAFSWDYPPTGPRGPKGDLDAEQLAGAPRLTNLVHDITWIADSRAAVDSQTDGLIKFTATAQQGYIRWNNLVSSGKVYYFTAEVKATSDQVLLGFTVAPVHHSGSGDWERLAGRVVLSGAATYFLVRDNRSSGWDQIEVRDLVLIDLTAAFGAGREPTKEYMDELLAKHNHYIGGVDQFAVGDALQALTVAGPGMTVRHDTTVGTRVFLDHPGGSTMLHGDTGWRRIPATSTQIPALTHMFIQRTTHHVHAAIYANHAFTPGEVEVIAVLPPGFRPATYHTRGRVPFKQMNAYYPDWASPTHTVVLRENGEVRLRMEGQSRIHATLTTYAEPAWPTVLPGEPV